MKHGLSRQIFRKIRKYQISRKPVVSRGQTDERPYMTKVIVAFRNFANALNNKYSYKNMTAKDVKR
jgi:hypothetical protein